MATDERATSIVPYREGGLPTVVRDALLPKLMSGEVRVREAERAVGGVA